MYDKRYSDQQIKRIRQWASGSMFFVMFLLCIGVGKAAYWMGHQNGYIEGYNDRMKDDVVNPVTSFVPVPAAYQVQKASFVEFKFHAEPFAKKSKPILYLSLAIIILIVYCGYRAFRHATKERAFRHAKEEAMLARIRKERWNLLIKINEFNQLNK